MGTRHIAEALTVNKKLTNLDLGDNGIALEGCRALAEMLAVNTTLARLEVSKNAGVSGSPALSPTTVSPRSTPQTAFARASTQPPV